MDHLFAKSLVRVIALHMSMNAAMNVAMNLAMDLLVNVFLNAEKRVVCSYYIKS